MPSSLLTVMPLTMERFARDANAREQSLSLREVSDVADQMDKVTRQNAAMVKETTTAAEILEKETETLAVLVGEFSFTTAGRNGARFAAWWLWRRGQYPDPAIPLSARFLMLKAD